MNEELQALMRKARRKLAAAESALRDGFPEDATSDAYYAMMHAARAMLLGRVRRITTHERIKKSFEGILVSSGKVDYKYLEYLNLGYQARHLADYETDLVATMTSEDAEVWIQRAAEFLAMAEKFIEGAGGERE